jgi:hypothetical protein
MKKLTLSYFLKALNFFFTDSGGLLPNFTVFIKTFLINQLPFKKLRIKLELLRHKNTNIDSLRYFSELLTLYKRNSYNSEEDSTFFNFMNNV